MDYQPLINHWQGAELERWAQLLESQIATGLCRERYGDLARWLQVLQELPPLQADAIHLATALLWKEQAGKELSMATHDVALAIAAKASGLRVIGA